MSDIDVIDALVGIEPGSALDGVRRQRPDTRTYAQASYDALFEATEGLVRPERLAVAAFVADLHGVGVEHYAGLLDAEDGALAAVVANAAESGRTAGPYGRYPAETVLHEEDTDGPRFVIGPSERSLLGERLTAALEHTHLLVYRPRESEAPALAVLEQAGWTTTEIVTLTQLVGFLAFQLRVVTGLSLLKELN